jgi:glutaredoxin
MFTKEGCSSCKAWKRLLDEYQKQQPMTAVFEVDAEKEMALAREFDIVHLPALFLYRDGQYHYSLQCAANLKILEGEIATALLKPPQEQP